jgi:hypothetical protein
LRERERERERERGGERERTGNIPAEGGTELKQFVILLWLSGNTGS